MSDDERDVYDDPAGEWFASVYAGPLTSSGSRMRVQITTPDGFCSMTREGFDRFRAAIVSNPDAWPE